MVTRVNGLPSFFHAANTGAGQASLDSIRNARLVSQQAFTTECRLHGAVAQLGERMTGSHEVRGSIPLGSTNRSTA